MTRSAPPVWPRAAVLMFMARFCLLIAAVSVAACHTKASTTGDAGSEYDGGALAIPQTDASSTALAFGDGGDGGAHRFQGEVDLVLRLADDDTEKADETRGIERYLFKIKGDAFRWDLYENSVPRGDFRIYDRSAHRFYTVLKSGGVILSTPESPALVVDPAASFVLEKLNEPGRVLGRPCDRYRARAGNKRFEICATDAIMAFPFQMMPGDMQATVPFGLELQHRNLFPLSVNEYEDAAIDAGAPLHASKDGGAPVGKFVASLRVVNVEERAIDDTDFELPKYPVTRTQKLQTQLKKPLR